MVSVCLPSDALLKHLLSHLVLSYLGCEVSLYGCSSKVQPLLLTSDKGYLLTTAPPDLEYHTFNITVIQVYAPTGSAEEPDVEWFYEDLQDLLELTQKRCPFHYRGLECKSRKSRSTWSNRQIWPWNME